MLKESLIEVLHEMEEVTRLFNLEPFDIYLIGGSACMLGEYTTRATIDVDFVDLGYPAKYGKVFVLLRDYDMEQNTEKFPKLKAFLWTISSRNMNSKKYNVSNQEDLEEQTKLINSFLKLAYWY